MHKFWESITGFQRWPWILAGIIVCAALWTGVILKQDTYDDAFIIFRYAYNFATGQGFVYNLGARHLSITGPFYGLLLGILGLLGPDSIPEIAGNLSMVSLVATGIALFRFGELHQQTFCGFLAGLFFVTHPLLIHTFGGEMHMQAALIAWAFVCYKAEKTVVSAVLLGAALLVRPDALLAAGVIGVHYLITRRRIPWREGLAMAIVVLPFAGLAWLYFGGILPDTFSSRLAQRDSQLWIPFLTGLLEWIRAFTVGGSPIFHATPFPDTLRFAVFVGLGVPALVFFRFWLLPLAWIGIYTTFYHLTGVPFYNWYLIPIVLGLSILMASGLAGSVEALTFLYARLVNRQSAFPVKTIGSILATGIIAISITAQIKHLQLLESREPNPVEKTYEAVGQWLQINTPGDTSVGYFEIGYIGYYSRRTIIDPLGLVDPVIVPHVSQGDFNWAYEHFRPDYILINRRIPNFGPDSDSAWFQTEYRQVEKIFIEGHVELELYARNMDVQ